MRRDNIENRQSQGLKRRIDDQKSPSNPVRNLQYRTARELPIYRYNRGMFDIICLRRKWKHFYSLWREGKQQSLKNVDKSI